MPVRACDRCYVTKEKCIFPDDQPTCARCRHLNATCSVSRANKRLGRRPTAKTFPHGQMQVWGVESHHPSKSPDGVKSRAVTINTRRPASKSILTPHTKPIQDLGSHIAFALRIDPERLLAAPTSLQNTSDALRLVSDPNQFAATHQPFMLGSSFAARFQESVSTILQLSAPTLTEGYLAFLALMTRYQNSLVLRREEPDLAKAARGLQRLRNADIRGDFDAASALFLGQAMYVFNLLTTTSTVTSHSILQTALVSTKRWFPRLVQSPFMDTVIMTPILIDTVECLAHREKPIIRFTPPADRVVVDHYAGLCATLLPHLYDICECSHALKKAGRDARPAFRAEIFEALAGIERLVQEWEPVTPEDWLARYERHEIMGMMAQSRLYRLAALLTIHRLRYPLGVEDETAKGYAMAIFTGMECFAPSFAPRCTAMPAVFPLVLAMFEVEGPGEELMESLCSSFTVQNKSVLRLQGFVKVVRDAKASGYGQIWFDLVDEHLTVAVPP
ncbi:transcriptional regulator family: Fungal Specific TF [Penicillium roqueforti]|nr:transcriptional regulator family: Fungal Specific TF [Penicillium roqueforti]